MFVTVSALNKRGLKKSHKKKGKILIDSDEFLKNSLFSFPELVTLSRKTSS
jgi:hypothetical protein